MLIIGRAIAGMGSSGLLSGGMTMIAGAVPLEKRPGKSIKLAATLKHHYLQGQTLI